MTRLLAALSIALLGLFATGCEAPGATDTPTGATDEQIDEVDDAPEETGGADTDTLLDAEGGPDADADADADAEGGGADTDG